MAAAVVTAPLVAQPEPDEFRLNQVTKRCGKSWVKKLRRLPQEQLNWIFQGDHRLLTVKLNSSKVMTLEILSGPSLRDCEPPVRSWRLRSTSIRATYFFADGSTKTKLVNFARDDVFFNDDPNIYASQGRALLRGIDSDGRGFSRWLPLDPLRSLYAQAMTVSPEPETLLAESGSVPSSEATSLH